jgi:hypothetical protein
MAGKKNTDPKKRAREIVGKVNDLFPPESLAILLVSLSIPW